MLGIDPGSISSLPDRLMAGRLVLVQVIGVRIPVREPKQKSYPWIAFLLCVFGEGCPA